MTQRQRGILLFAMIGVLIVLGAIALLIHVEYGSSPSDDPATASCREAYSHGGAAVYHLSENDYIDKCVQGIRDLHSSS